MKKGDLIQMREEIPKGKALMHGYTSVAKAEEALRSVTNHYNLPLGAVIGIGNDDCNSGLHAVIAFEDTYITVDARVNWIVDNEVGITYIDNGGSQIIDLNEQTGWVVIKSATPMFQSDAEHMSDDELRASIEALRSNRIAKPVATTRKKVIKKKEPPMSAQDKKLSQLLSSLDSEAKLALQKKLGLI